MIVKTVEIPCGMIREREKPVSRASHAKPLERCS